MGDPTFVFHGGLDRLLPRARRGACLRQAGAQRASIKHAIEALGVPHTEVGAVRVDGRDAGLDEPIGESARIEVFPPAPGEGRDPLRFLADAHLGALARRLRLLGFDTVLARDGPDRELARLALAEDRIVLSRDRALLEHRRVQRGRFVRAQQVQEQLLEVAHRFGLAGLERPFTRCLECNGLLEPVEPEAVAASLPPAVAASQREFTRCADCALVYWPGTHWQRLRALVEEFQTLAGTAGAAS